MSADHETISRSVLVTDGVFISVYSVHLDDDQMQIAIATRAGNSGFLGTSYLAVDQARRLAAALVECADQYETVRAPAEGGAP